MLGRIIAVWRDRAGRADLVEEMEAHRAMIQARLEAAGMSAADAAMESRRRMGNLTLAREDARSVWMAPWIDSIRQDIGYATRMLRHAPAFTGAMILVMALGIGATTAVFSLVDGLVLKSLPVRAPEQLFYVSTPSFSYPVFAEIRARGASVFSHLSAWSLEDMHVAWGRELEPTEVLTASGDFYATLGIDAAIGRTFTADDDQIGGGPQGLVAVISYAAWQQRFSRDPSVVGRTVRVDDLAYTIVGVTPEGFFGVTPGVAPEITIPLTSNQDQDELRQTSSSWVHLLGRLRDGVDLSKANAAFQTFWPGVLEATTNPGMSADRRAAYQGQQAALHSAHAGFSRVRNQFADPLWLLLGLVALLLTVACASAANLLLARGVGRQREIAVRLAIGAGRGRLIRQMLTESIVWTALAAATGLLFASWGASTIVTVMSRTQAPIALDVRTNWRTLLFSMTLALLTAAVCSIIPALRATRIDPATSLKNTGQVGNALLGRWSLGKVLVAAQVAVTVLLLAGASLFLRSLDRALSQNAGFDRDNVLVVTTDPEAAGYDDERLSAFYDQLLQRVTNVPGVASASLSQYPPISDDDGAWTQSIAIDGAAVTSEPGQSMVYFNAISPGYFQTIGMQLLRGRDFAREDAAAAPPVAIVNESLARRFFPGQDPIGHQIVFGRNANRRTLQVVGVVRDAKYQRLQEQPRSIAYVPWKQARTENLFMEVRPAGSMTQVADAVRREVRAIDGVVPVRVATVADRIRESLITERVLALLATSLGVAALALACAGLYGLLAYAVSRQTRDIGLRLALGADRSTVVRMVLIESVIVSLVGIVAGLAGSLALGRFTRTLLFQITPGDPAALVAAAALMLIVAGAAAFFPARRAARIDPVAALRCE